MLKRWEEEVSFIGHVDGGQAGADLVVIDCREGLGPCGYRPFSVLYLFTYPSPAILINSIKSHSLISTLSFGNEKERTSMH